MKAFHRAMMATAIMACRGPSVTAPALTDAEVTGPTRVADGTISTADPEFATARSADGRTIYFNRLDATRQHFELLRSVQDDRGRWSEAVPVWFAAPPARDVDPFLTFDERELIFSSNRARPGTTSSDFNLWRVSVVPGTPPRMLPPAINTEHMEVYGGLDRAGRFVFARTIGDATRVFEVDSLDGVPRDVAPGLSASLSNPMLSPDGRWLVVASDGLPGHGAADLFVLHRIGGGWSEPINLGPLVNGPSSDFAPSFSPDQRTLYFTSERSGIVGETPPGRRPGDLYSIPTAVLDALRIPACTGLGVRNAHGTGLVDGSPVVIGGADEATVRGDGAVLSATTFHPAPAGGPSARTFPMVVADARGLVVFGGNPVLFGAGAPPLFGDTWTLRAGSWRRSELRRAPSPRAEVAAAFDARRGRVVLFGGYTHGADGIVRYGDLWEWDGTRWSLPEVSTTAPRPSPRHGAAMAYDESRGAVLVFGGSTDRGLSPETWSWDGERWGLVDATAPALYGAAAAWDPASGRVIRFGGWDGVGRVGETWAFTRRRWLRVAHAGPSPRNHTAMVSTRDGVYLVGGHDGARVFGDVWRWQAHRWVPVCLGEPRHRIDNQH